ncbi:CBD9-like protein [Corynespora cassiicola Philippines]|uniref:CBD9-like protein n=1 Tax=Corynespora cassiicola Philippines TaxID=1448308 RepID=A0A2T2PA70_CORCC|nr:CBD9-like protein [Corynespora cassiicola Philippines]
MNLRSTLALSVSAAHAGISTQCPSQDLCFSLNIPEATISSGANDLYLQITGPTSFSWISVAQGEQMAGSHYFVLYTSADGNNITVSPRLADGQVPPNFTPETQLEILEGSGVANGKMTANIKCTNCSSWDGGSMDLTSDSTSWIWAHKAGDPINSDDTSARISIHDQYGRVAFDSTAHGGSSANPFVTTPDPASPAPIVPADSGNGESTASFGPPARIVRLITAHAVLACIAWAGFFPLGGVMMRLCHFRNLIWVHAGVQVFGYCIYIAAVGIGIKLASNPRYYYLDDKHAIIGLVVFGLFFIQIISGWLHHVLFKKYMSRNLYSYIHMWTARLCITLGIINGGFGFQLTHKGLGTWQVMTYTVFAVVMWVVYVAAVIFKEVTKNKGETRLLADGGSGTSSGTHTPDRREKYKPGETSSSEEAVRAFRTV